MRARGSDGARARPRRRTAWGWAALGLLLCAVALGAWALWRGSGSLPPAGRTPSPRPQQTRPQPTRPTGAPVSGPATAIDGDTLDIRGTRVRLFGIDAPEHDQTCRRAGKTYACGQEALGALRGLLAEQAVRCTPRATDRYGRTVAVCAAGGQDVNGWMVARGYALAYRDYSTDYVAQENAARKARRGLHAGTYVNPADFRRGGAAPAAPPAPARRAPYASCAQARAAGHAPVLRGEGGYNPKLDGDADGRMCE
ncbi:thermonuclease family protein [Deinococcus koreensis]|uniref:Nuclease n=1 Tax=Deinococcus koreensis TaxID=2054903 RepID=A0A2K3UXP4_9DEIO|nr:thermonuclease family protein [Deinococcus koreensis]PNY81307.1 nuclease [Deinococcus koreensis]